MILTSEANGPRALRAQELSSDLIVVGGGIGGVCCAITAARAGVRVVLVQDRPVLGGNASSEVRLWMLGATSHMGNNNRWAREGGVVDELLVENIWRNPEGNAIVLDSLMLEFVTKEPNITLLLNTAVYAAETSDKGVIAGVSAFCSQNQIDYKITAPLFCDASGDGILGFLSGAAFRMGMESKSEFGEGLAPEESNQELLGHTLYFYSRDTGKPVKYVAPSFALADITKIPRYRDFTFADSGCRLWWLEYGGNMDTVYESEDIKWELWRIAYGLWNYIKNSGNFPEAETLTLEWMGTIPGKRESRRFEGDHILTQQDIVEQRRHPDAVSYGGWAIDLHPAEGVYSTEASCTQWHSKGVYQVPFRTMYSRNVSNLFLAGRIISATHIAFGSTRVMVSCGHNGQAVGMAAALCKENGLKPRDIVEPKHMRVLQQRLLRTGQYIPGVAYDGAEDKARTATISASSILRLRELKPSGELKPLETPTALLLPLSSGAVPSFTIPVQVKKAATLHAELWTSSREGNTTPDVLLAELKLPLTVGDANVVLNFKTSLAKREYVFVVLHPTEGVSVALSQDQITGVLTVAQKMNKAVCKSSMQIPPEGTGVDSFAFWIPDRRPFARNLAVQINPPLASFDATNVVNGFQRPWTGVNAWLSAAGDSEPKLTLKWPEAQKIRVIEIVFDTDSDHPMESVLMGHPERVMPGCVTAFDVYAANGRILSHVEENHQTIWRLQLQEEIETDEISIVVRAHGPQPPAIFAVRCYA